jgi:hypothetical protein
VPAVHFCILGIRPPNLPGLQPLKARF